MAHNGRFSVTLPGNTVLKLKPEEISRLEQSSLDGVYDEVQHYNRLHELYGGKKFPRQPVVCISGSALHEGYKPEAEMRISPVVK
jgi:hypothetical protein